MVSMRIGRDLLESQQDEAFRDGFERLLRENLSEIPQDCPLQVAEGDTGQTVVLGRATGLFPVAGMPLVMESVAIQVRRDRSGSFSLWLLYYDGNYWNALQDNAIEEESLIEIPFCSGFEWLEWKVYDQVADEWLEKWEEGGRRPHYLELNYRFSGDACDSRMVFWLPRLQNIPGGGARPNTPDPNAPSDPNAPNAPGGVPLSPPSGVPGIGLPQLEIK